MSLRALSRAMRHIDENLRRSSRCPDCGKPQSGFIRMARPRSLGRASGRLYGRGETLDLADAGLCTCPEAPSVEAPEADEP